MSDEPRFQLETRRTGQETAAILRELADVLERGTEFTLADPEGRSVTLDAPAELDVEIELEDEGDAGLELELELSWPPESASEDGQERSAAETAADLEVTAADEATSLARFEVFRDRADEWRWRLVHRNGNVIATSGEGYTSRHNAEKGLRSVVANAPGAEVEDA